MEDAPIHAVAFYTGLNAMILLWYAARIVGLRQEKRISIGDGGDALLARAMRGQANFVELVPMALMQLLLMALIGAPGWLIHLFGVPLTGARVLHATYFLAVEAPMHRRVLATAITLAVIGLSAAGLILHALFQVF